MSRLKVPIGSYNVVQITRTRSNGALNNKVNPSLINASNLKHYHDPDNRVRFEPQPDPESDGETTDSEQSDNEAADNPQPLPDSQDENENTQVNTQNCPFAKFRACGAACGLLTSL